MISHSALRAALAAASVAFTFALAPMIVSAENPKTQTPAATTPQERESPDAKKEDRPDCKKIYQHVHRGHPGKGTDQLKLVRVECPTPRA